MDLCPDSGPDQARNEAREQEDRLQFAVLGPLRAWRGGSPVPLGAPQQRALLAALLLDEGRVVATGELIDALWGEQPPNTAIAALRNYASGLRKSLGPSATLTNESGGYAIRIEDGALDLDVAEDHAAAADRVRGSDPQEARRLLNAALGLWEGEALAGVPGPAAQSQRTRIEQWRLRLLESRLEADLETGGHEEAVCELTALTSAHPLRELLRAQLMLALYRGGRQAEALAVYSDTRLVLAEELGVDPCQELRALHQSILESDPALAAPSEARGSTEPLPRPAQLPPPVGDFTGRARTVRDLCRRLADGTVGGPTVVVGTGGVGKTTLTVHAAHTVRGHFPDGQLYADLQGTGPDAVPPEVLLGSFLRALGIPASAIPDSTRERAALYRSALDGRRLLVLLDNARDADQVRPLLPSTPGCAALVNSRSRMPELAGAHLTDLDVMSAGEALELFAAVVGEERAGAEPDAASQVVEACGFLPLAIRIAASRLASRPAWPISRLAGKLADRQRVLRELRTGGLAVDATFALGYAQLERQQARAFRLLGLVDSPDVSARAAAALLDLDPYETEELLESLVDASLLESAAPGRYRHHDLVRLYACACADRDETPESREQALSRLLDFYLATTAHVYDLERPAQSLQRELEPTTHPGLAFAHGTEALEWMSAERKCLLACLTQLTGRTQLRRSVDLLRLVSDLCHNHTDTRQFEHAGLRLLSRARAAGDQHAQARVEIALTWAAIVRGHFAQAERYARAAHEHGSAAGDWTSTANSTNDLGIIAQHRGRHAEAEAHLVRALAAFRDHGSEPAEASVLCNLSRTYLETGQLEAAVRSARQGVAIYRRTGATMRLANGMYQLGIALTRTGDTKEAEKLFTGALTLFRASGNPFWTGMTHHRLAELHLAAHRPEAAARESERALRHLRGSCGELWLAEVLTVLGRALAGARQTDRARACWWESLELYERLGSDESQRVAALLDRHPGNLTSAGRPDAPASAVRA